MFDIKKISQDYLLIKNYFDNHYLTHKMKSRQNNYPNRLTIINNLLHDITDHLDRMKYTIEQYLRNDYKTEVEKKELEAFILFKYDYFMDITPSYVFTDAEGI